MLRSVGLKDGWLQFARVVGGHEREQVAFLRHALGSAAQPRPRMTLQREPASLADFRQVAIELERMDSWRQVRLAVLPNGTSCGVPRSAARSLLHT